MFPIVLTLLSFLILSVFVRITKSYYWEKSSVEVTYLWLMQTWLAAGVATQMSFLLYGLLLTFVAHHL